MFLEPRRNFATDPFRKEMSRFTPEFRAEIERESVWIPQNPEPAKFTKEEAKSIGLGLTQCPHCSGTGNQDEEVRGKDTGLWMIRQRRCECKRAAHFWGIWKNVPERFQEADLRTLEPKARMGITRERQAEIIALMRDNWSDSFFLYGAVGTGKTHFMTALYRKVVHESVKEQFLNKTQETNVWRISTLKLLQENTEWNARDLHDPNCTVPAPTLTVDRIETIKTKYGLRPHLFLDELDKVSMTDPKAAVLDAIVDAVYKHGGQLVATSNRGYMELSKKWGWENAGTVVRRIGVDDGDGKSHSIDFGIPAAKVKATPTSRTTRDEKLTELMHDHDSQWQPSETPGTATKPAVRQTASSLPSNGPIDGSARQGAQTFVNQPGR
jgi:DNA replication protein DnaC